MEGRSHQEVEAKMLDCDTLVSEFELQSRYYVHSPTYTLWKGMNPLISLQLWVK